MGLDMYLSAKLHTSDYFAADHPVRPAVNAVDWPGTRQGYNDVELKATVACWRKANQVHKWFVDNVQDGKDDCGYYGLDLEQIEKLCDLCEELLLTRNPTLAKEHLPPQAGFFFGGTDLDQYYWEDLEHTVKQLQAVLNHPSAKDFEYEYHSSW